MSVWRFSFSKFGDEAIKCVFGLCYLLCHCPSKCSIIIEGSAKVSDLDWGRGGRWEEGWCGLWWWSEVVVGVERPSLQRKDSFPLKGHNTQHSGHKGQNIQY